MAQVEPLETLPRPAPAFSTARRREAALRAALRGVALGAYDERLITWAARSLDEPTVQTLTGWLERARRAETTAERSED
jgi:hypothetical protein